ncbi:MAG TPA: SDR family oxidoreductase [Ohtaekwangia sp.]|uniref:SDR family NAD(P)-dependent oxidoreductase n=1 Tax=Ohtaekwangia sp. TaxID=2066019 RepID=UPI002F95F508
MKKQKQQFVLVTGGTSGIGYELAKLFAKNGHNLILVARSKSDLEMCANEFKALHGVDVITIAKDLFEPNAPFEIYEEVKLQGAIVSILVNDAGQGVYGKFAEEDIHRQLRLVQLNIVALTALTYLFLQDMIVRKEGRILQLGSIVSEIPAPLQAVYGGTKAYVLSFTEALVNELKDTDITVTALQPGATKTDFFNKAGAQNSKIVKETELSDPADVARDGYEALMRGDDKVVSGFKNKVQSTMSNVIPDTMLADNMRKQSEESKKK